MLGGASRFRSPRATVAPRWMPRCIGIRWSAEALHKSGGRDPDSPSGGFRSVTLGRVRVAAHLRGGPEVDRRRPAVLAQRTVRQQSANEAPLPLRTTDESQGSGADFFGGAIGRVSGRAGRQIGSCELGFGGSAASVGAVLAGICAAVSARRACRRGCGALGCWWARVTDVAKRRRQEL